MVRPFSRSVILASLLAMHSALSLGATIEFRVSVDDYGALRVDGTTVASYDAFPWGDAYGTIDRSPGWYPIDLLYQNRYGSTALHLFERSSGAANWTYVPRTRLRSLDSTGNLVRGLRADYSDLDGNYLGTVYGEGPIANGWYDRYQGTTGSWGNGLVDTNWGQFQERLTGEIRIPSTSPSVATLARLSNDAYRAVAYGADGYSLIDTRIRNGFNANAYLNNDQIVVAFRGTEQNSGGSTAVKNLLANASFVTGVPTLEFSEYISFAASFLESVASRHPDTEISLTGHSLGGAIAQLIGSSIGLRATTFDAPGAGALAPSFANQLASLNALSGGAQATPENYRMYGDAVSLAGSQIGRQITVDPPAPLTTADIDATPELLFLKVHDMDALAAQLGSGATLRDGVFGGTPLVNGVNFIVASSVTSTLRGQAALFAFQVLSAGTYVLIDPPGATDYEFMRDGDSPFFQSVMLPAIGGVHHWRVAMHRAGAWADGGSLSSLVALTLDPEVDGVRFTPLGAQDEPLTIAEDFTFAVAFGSTGSFAGRLESIGAVPEPSVVVLLVPSIALVAFRARQRHRVRR